MTTSPWQSIGGDRAILRERRIVIQNSDGYDLIELGKDDGGRWTLAFRDGREAVVLRSGEFSDGLYGMQALDAQGNERVRIGEISEGHYGLRVKNAAGDTLLEVNNEGQALPHLVIPMGSTAAFTTVPVQGASYGADGIWFADFYCVAPNVKLTHGLSWASGTYAVRTRAYVNGSYYTLHEVDDIEESTTTVVDEPLPAGAIGTEIRVQVEALRSSGSDLGGLGILAHPRNYG